VLLWLHAAGTVDFVIPNQKAVRPCSASPMAPEKPSVALRPQDRLLRAALLRRDGVSSQTWGIGSSAPAALRASEMFQRDEALLEQQVSRYIGAMTVLWIDVPDEPSATSVRAVIERNAIGLLSNGFMPIDAASPNWLGHHSPRDAIRRSHLWNLNYVDQPYDRGFLDQLEAAAERTCEQRG
jgi:hypothetical protein